MKNKLLLPICVIMALFLYSCELGIDGGNGNQNGGGFPAVPRYMDFWAQDTTNDFYELRAQLLYEGARCNVWAEVTSGVRPVTAQEIANTFDNTIYQRMINAFNSADPLRYDGKVFSNAVELADYRGDEDGKLTILLLDIRDSANLGGGTGYVVGYFFNADLYSKSTFEYSNESDMIYINSRLQNDLDDLFGTLAHEMQHLMNYVTSGARRTSRMDTWIDECLAESSQWIGSQKHTQERINWFNVDPAQTIAEGNNFFVWGNPSGNILDDYATAYLFFQWLRLQSGGGTNIYRDIFHSPYFDLRAVTTAANSAMPGRGYSDWGELLKTWLAANFINASSGPYGYMNDTTLRTVKHRYVLRNPPTMTSFPLLPGEGIFTERTSMPTATPYVKYAGLTANGNLSNSEFVVLLSYNVDLRLEGPPSPASPFNEETLISVSGRNMISRNLSQPCPLSWPLRISMWDMIRRKEHEENVFYHNLVKLRDGVGAYEYE